MKRTLMIGIISLFIVNICLGQNSAQARKILDKTASVLSRKGGVSAKFNITASQGGANGTLYVKGNKFKVVMPEMTIWNNGKTQWAYMKSTDEVNVSTPSESQQQAVNPYHFINLYKSGFNLSMKTQSKGWLIHLVAQNSKRSIKEMYVSINKSYQPYQIKMRHSNGWTTININSMKTANLSDKLFVFNKKECPTAEIIDLR